MTMPTPYRPTEHPLAAQQSPVEGQIVPADSGPMVWAAQPGGGWVVTPRSAIPAHLLPPEPTPPRDLSPQPIIDPRAQVLAAGGVGVGVAGWGLGQLLTAMAGMGAAAVGALALLILAVRMPGRRGADAGGQQQAQQTSPRGDVYNITNHTTVTNTNRWGGRSTTNL